MEYHEQHDNVDVCSSRAKGGRCFPGKGKLLLSVISETGAVSLILVAEICHVFCSFKWCGYFSANAEDQES